MVGHVTQHPIERFEKTVAELEHRQHIQRSSIHPYIDDQVPFRPVFIDENTTETETAATASPRRFHQMTCDDATTRLELSEEDEGLNQDAIGDHSMVCINPKRRKLRIVGANVVHVNANMSTSSAVSVNARHVITSGSRGIGAVATPNSLD